MEKTNAADTCERNLAYTNVAESKALKVTAYTPPPLEPRGRRLPSSRYITGFIYNLLTP